MGKLIVAFSSVADARVSRLIQRCQELGVDVSVVPRMFDTMNNRAWYDTVGGTAAADVLDSRSQGAGSSRSSTPSTACSRWCCW